MTTPSAIFIRSVCVIFVISILHQICAFQVPVKRLKKSDFHKFRIPRAESLRNYMNESVDPCFDFYEFACGNWQSHHPATEDTPITSPMTDLADKVNEQLQNVLEDGVKKTDGTIGRKVKDFYASCMDSETASQSMNKVFLDFVGKNLGMPAVPGPWEERSYNWVTQISNLRKQYGMDIIIGLNINVDMKNKQDSRINIGEPSTLIPKDVCKEGDLKNSIYDELRTEITDNMAYWFEMDKSEGETFATDLLNFETILCQGMSEEMDPSVMPNTTRTSFKELDSKFPKINNFYNFATTSLDQVVPPIAYIQNEDYFHHLSKVMPHTPKRVIANYIMYRALYAISFPGEDDKAKRASLCVEMCMKHFSKAIGEMYSREKFLTEKEEDVRQIWMKLIRTFNTDIGSQLWIEENTRRQAIYKINRMELRFPNYLPDFLLNEYGSVRIDKGLFWQNVLNLLELKQKHEIKKLYSPDDGIRSSEGREVEAFDINVGYSITQNIIRMPMGLLQPPVYHRTAPYSYKYGVLGFLIAREQVHGFDENGWNYDESSAMRQWWDQKSTLQYKERAACFRDQYVSYAGEDSGLSPVELDKKIQEIIADNGALNISFNAYLQWLEETDEPHILHDETLSEVDYTNTQLFFISFAQNFCTSIYSKEEPIGFFSWDVPNYLEKFQVNGLLWNMKEFSREFNCRPGTEMNPGDKCVIY